MRILYTFGVLCYGFAIRISSLFNPKAREWVNGRKNWSKNLPNTENRLVIWFHCASLGEFDQGLPLMERIKKDRPNSFLIVTFFSPSGMQHYHKRQHCADHVMYMPLDTPLNARRFIHYFRPYMSIFVKYEFWSNHILAARECHSRIFNISGLFRPSQRFFQWYGGFFRKTLGEFEWFFVQNDASVKLLASIGLKNSTVSGDSRFDRVLENSRLASSNVLIEDFCSGQPLLVIGSSWPQDERLLAPFLQKYSGKVLLAPHAIDEAHIQDILTLLPGAVRYSACEKGMKLPEKILVLDTIGQLANAYSYGSVAYVGGGFSGSLHNILEPAVFGLPVIFGPKHSRFPEAQHFINEGIGFSVETTVEFQKAFEKITANLPEMKSKTRAFVEANAGAADRILSAINSK